MIDCPGLARGLWRRVSGVALLCLLGAAAASAQPQFPTPPRDSVRVPTFPGTPGTPSPPPTFPGTPGTPAPPPGFPGTPGSPAPPPGFPGTPEAPGGPPAFPATPRPPSVRVALRFVLEGAYASGLPGEALMRSELEDALPLAHPYGGAPWLHAGTESLPDASGAVLAANAVVDWVLVCIRSQPTDANTACAAVLLLADGSLLDPETGESAARIGPALTGQYYVAVYHRTHLAAMTAAAMPLADADAANVRSPASLTTEWYGGGVKPLAAGVVGLYAGDGDGDGSILAPDQQSVWLPTVGQAGYLAGDFDLDGSVLANDQQVFWLPNVGVQSAVPGASSLTETAPEARLSGTRRKPLRDGSL